MNSKRPSSVQSKVPFWKLESYQNKKSTSQPKSKLGIDFVLSGNSEVGISMPYSLYDGRKKQLIKNAGGIWDDSNKLWLVQTQSVKELANSFKTQYPDISVNQIPDLVYRALKPLGQTIQIKNPNGKVEGSVTYSDWDLNFKPQILLPFHDKLFKFQQQSVKFGIEHHGRILLADEMGVGKTIQALALAYIYKQDWPLLIVCPSSLKYNWQDEILRWYKDIRKFQIDVVKKKVADGKKQKSKIVIISYEMCRKYIDQFNDFKIAIVDQAHYLKTLDSKRSQTLVPFLKNRKRVLLLTGTPALAKPRQLFNILSIVRPDIYYNFKEFGNRYCDPQKSPWSNVIEYNGCKFPNELYYMIKDRAMIRRLKKQVLTQLPPKIRQKIIIQCDAKFTKQIAQMMSSNPQLTQQNYQQNFQLGSESEQPAFNNAYLVTAQAKIQGVKSYLKQLIQNDVKMIIFAHHRIMLDAIQQLLEKQNVKFMRIDGNTTPQKRNQYVNEFQSKSTLRVALLSITAAGVGLTLTASSTVIFTQLHWTPAVMFQAEDRAHRIGQPSCVNCHYLVGQCTLDDYIYLSLQKKFNSVSLMVDGQTNKIGAQNLQKGQIGDISKAAEAIKKLQQSYKKQKPVSLYSFWKDKIEESATKPGISQYSEISITQKQTMPLNVQDLTQSQPESMNSQEQLQMLLLKKNEMIRQSKRISDATAKQIDEQEKCEKVEKS